MKIYFIGIAGAGMHSLALYLSDAGHDIGGSDPGASEAVCDFWRQRNLEIHREQRPENIQGYDLVVYSAAVPATNPERKAAQLKGIACSRGEALARFANAHRGSIAICGTHGKGTTAGAVLKILSDAGLRVSDILGAVPIGCRQPSLCVPNADFLVCEVDESDRTNLCHRPAYLLINNVEEDHLNVYRDLDDIVESFAHHVCSCLETGTKVVIHYAGIGAPKLYALLKDRPEIAWVAREGVLESPALAYDDSQIDAFGRTQLVFREKSGLQFAVTPRLRGVANAQNIASALCLARCIGLSIGQIIPPIERYDGLKDRCQIQHFGDVQLVTDYASHPTCVQNDIAWVSQCAKRVIAIYHPYRYSLMNCHWHALSQKLAVADIVLLAPFDGAGEHPIEGLCSENLAERIQRENDRCRAFAYRSFSDLESAANTMIQHGDCLIVFGGGFLFEMGRRIVSGFEPHQTVKPNPA